MRRRGIRLSAARTGFARSALPAGAARRYCSEWERLADRSNEPVMPSPGHFRQSAARAPQVDSWREARVGYGSVAAAPPWDDDDSDEVPSDKRRRRRRRRVAAVGDPHGAAAGAAADAPGERAADAAVDGPEAPGIWRVVWPNGTAWRTAADWDARFRQGADGTDGTSAFVPCGSRGRVAARQNGYVQDEESGLWLPLRAPDGARLTLVLAAAPPSLQAEVECRCSDPRFRRAWVRYCDMHGGKCTDPKAHDETWLRDSLRFVADLLSQQDAPAPLGTVSTSKAGADQAAA
eukprot:TRINITY_DN60452_c0_g1_i1.p1 TRINITY_DN60452_c0_g1~~TRINITY_DN60452_c0_g1_i1.p1  ORF type:complete len:291 (+),score=34.27 TRINITY_DN60452_c0_g1_i1:71-943(+)